MAIFFPDPYGYIEFTTYGDVYTTSNNSGWLGGSEGVLVQPVALGLGFLDLISTLPSSHLSLNLLRNIFKPCR